MAKSYSLKQLKIDKDNQDIVIVTAITVFVIIFSLLSSKSLLSQRAYNNRLATAQQAALNQLSSDISAKNSLVNSYSKFISPAQNIIGGNSTGSGPNDGNNAQIVLDALPSKYDFPALATSIQTLLSKESVKIDGISGTDEQATQQTNTTSSSPSPVAMPISFTVDGSYQSIVSVLNDVQNSIRPVQIQNLTLSGDETDLQLSITAQSFYQPEKDFTIGSETVQ